MIRKIYKYDLPTSPGSIKVIKEKVLQYLSIQSQNNVPTLWALVDAEDTSAPTDIYAFGTGWELPDCVSQYLGTLQTPQGYVWHYFTLDSNKEKKEDDFAVLAQAIGQTGISADEAAQTIQKVFNMEGLFDACM